MPRNPMQDIVPKGRSIRNVPLSSARSKSEIKKLEKDIEVKEEAEAKLEEDIAVEREELEETRSYEPAPRRRNGRGFLNKRTYVIGGAILVIALILIVSNALHSATVTVTPRTMAASVNSDYIAKKTPGSTDLGFKLLTATETGSETVRATGQKQVNQKATGVITIFNNYSSASQRLIVNTRFATPEGLIFRITSSVTVPGKKGTTPGSVDATVIADQAGADYNVGLKDFTIPGFKGDPRYTGFYGRSKTPLAGGFVGTQPVISDTDRAKAKADIEAKLQDALVKDIAGQVATDTVVFDKAYTIDYKSLPDENASAGQATIKETGTIDAAAFSRADISAALARTYVQGYKGEPIDAGAVESLAFSPKDFHPGSSDTIAFHVTGNVNFEWLYDASTLKTALAGQPRSAVPAILAKFPQIQKADISIAPFWSSTFPGSTSRITVK